MHLGWSWLGLLAAYFWASSFIWWLLDAVLQLLLIAAIHMLRGLGIAPILAWWRCL